MPHSPSYRLLLLAPLLAPLFTTRPLPHEVWVGTAIAENGSSMRGDLEMFAGKAPNTTFVELAQRNDTPGAMRSWRVRYGTCAKPGMAFGDSATYPVIRIGKDGKGVGTVTLRVACGDLVLED